MTHSCQRGRTHLLSVGEMGLQDVSCLVCWRAMRWSLAVVTLLAAAPVLAKRPPVQQKFHFELTSVEATPSAPAEISVKARTLFVEIVSAHADFLPTLDGAPDGKAQPAELRRWLDDHKVRAFTVQLKLDSYERSLAPDPRQAGQVLTIKVGVSLIGAQIPGGALALAGSGGSMVMAQVGQTLRPREEEGAMDDALKDALSHALDDAIAKLQAPPRKVKKR